MTFQLPDLNTVPASQLLDELAQRIPHITGQWTDQNPSDPGITLLEMLAWIVEATAYQANVVPIEAYVSMLRLVLGLAYGAEARPYAEPAAIGLDPHYYGLQSCLKLAEKASPDHDVLREAMYAFNSARYLALTKEDIETLAFESNGYILGQGFSAQEQVVRADARYNGEAIGLGVVIGDPKQPYLRYNPPALQHSRAISGNSCTAKLVVDYGTSVDRGLSDKVLGLVRNYVAPRTMLGNPISIHLTAFQPMQVLCTVRCLPRQRLDLVAENIAQSIIDQMQPRSPNRGASALQFGMPLTAEAIMPALHGVDGIDVVGALDVMPCFPKDLRTIGDGLGPVLPTSIHGQPIDSGGLEIVAAVQVTTKDFGTPL
jgi:hypothetical protein